MNRTHSRTLRLVMLAGCAAATGLFTTACSSGGKSSQSQGPEVDVSDARARRGEAGAEGATDALNADARLAQTEDRLAWMEQAMASTDIDLDAPQLLDAGQVAAMHRNDSVASGSREYFGEQPAYGGDEAGAIQQADASAMADAAQPVQPAVLASPEAEPIAAMTEPVPAPAPPPPPPPTRAELIRQLAAMISADSAQGAVNPAAPLIRVAALDLIDPGAGASSAGVFDTTGLTSAELEFIGAFRQFCQEAGGRLDSAMDVSELEPMVRRLAGPFDTLAGLRVASAALCTRVDGFGVYRSTALADGSYRMLAGRRQRLIVYTEIDGFTPRPTTEGGITGFSVDLTQDLALYADNASPGTDVVAWRMPDHDFADFSRHKRRDFFVTQIIELPDTLSVGGYRLKITIRDRNGPGGAAPIAESIIPISVVADSSAMAP